MVGNPYKIRNNVTHIFITVDPSSGKDRNLYAICSTIYVDDMCVVCLLLLLYINK